MLDILACNSESDMLPSDTSVSNNSATEGCTPQTLEIAAF